MGRLIVEAGFGSEKLVDGSETTATLCVSVTDEAGRPVPALKKGAFKVGVVQSEIVGGEAGDIYQPIELASVTDFVLGNNLHGVYHVGVKPMAGYRWGRSRIVLGLEVSRGLANGNPSGSGKTLPTISFDQGQTLVAFEVN